MSCDSLTWQFLPAKWLAPVMDGVISLAEAAELWDLLLLNPNEWVEPPKHLRPAVSRLLLWQQEVSPTLH